MIQFRCSFVSGRHGHIDWRPFHVTCRVDLTPFIATLPRSKYVLLLSTAQARPCESDVCDATKGNAKRGRDPLPLCYWLFVYVILSHSGASVSHDWIGNTLDTHWHTTYLCDLEWCCCCNKSLELHCLPVYYNNRCPFTSTPLKSPLYSAMQVE